MSIKTSRRKVAAEVHGQVDHLGDRLGVLAVDVENGDLEHLGHVAGVVVERPSSGGVVKPIWLLTMTWSAPPIV